MESPLREGTINGLQSLQSTSANAPWQVPAGTGRYQTMSELRALLDINLKEAGAQLSVGQRMLIALSRALLQGARMIVLDEIGAALDRASYLQVLSAVLQYVQKKPETMVLAVVHRLEEVQEINFATHVLTLDRGTVVQFGAYNPRSVVTSRQLAAGKLPVSGTANSAVSTFMPHAI